jgi:hypothetical protein
VFSDTLMRNDHLRMKGSHGCKRRGIGRAGWRRSRVRVFASYSYENLRADIARGSGEHLVSLATLAGVPPGRQTEFQDQMRNAYSTMFNETLPVRESTVRVVNAAWSEGFGRLEAEGTEHRSSLIPNVELRAKKAPRSTVLMSRE